VTLVVDSSLNAVTNVDSEVSLSVSESIVDSHVSLEGVRAEVGVICEVGEILEGHLAGVRGSLLRADVLAVSTSGLNPSGEGLDVGGETSRRIVVSVSSTVGLCDLLVLLHHVSGTGSGGGGSGEHTVVDATFGLLVGAEGTDGHGVHGLGLVDHGS